MAKKITKITTFQAEVNRVLRILKKEIYSGQRLPHERLVENNLAETYSASRIIIRQVLSLLALDNLVEIEPYKGAKVAAITIDRIVETYEVVSMLEGYATKLAVKNITEEDIDYLKENLNSQKKVKKGDASSWQVLNKKFHKRINLKCGNEKIIQLIRHHAQFTNYWFLIFANPAGFHRDIEAHENILQALIDGNGEMARETMEKHITVVVKDLVDNIKKRVPIGMFRTV